MVRISTRTDAKAGRTAPSDLAGRSRRPPQKSINYWVYALSNSLAKGASNYYGRVHDTNLPEMRILSNLHSNGDMAARDLVRATVMDKGLVSRVLSGLRNKGIVELLADGDRVRLRRWTLTRKGQDLVARLQPEWMRREAIIQSGLTATERRQLLDLLQRLFNASEALRLEEKDLLDGSAEPPAGRHRRGRTG